MSWRTVIIDSQSKLDYKMGYLVVRNSDTKRVLIDEIAVLMIENPAVSITGFLLEVLVEKKVKVVFCDAKRNPVAELVPHHGAHDSTEKIRMQIAWDNTTKAVVWHDIVSEKIRKQSDFLAETGHQVQAEMLMQYLTQIEMADVTNREGHAAKVYFNALFGMDFTRSADTPTNAALNYGYSLILSAFNREISANGYLTQLGIFHSNTYNHFNLAYDFMEPFRVLVDRMVYHLSPLQFEKEEKHMLWQLFDRKIIIDGQKQFFGNAIKIYTKSVLDALNDRDSSKIKFFNINTDSFY